MALAFFALLAVACGSRTAAVELGAFSPEGGVDADRDVVVEAARGVDLDGGAETGVDVEDDESDSPSGDAQDASDDTEDDELPDAAVSELPSTAPCRVGGNIFWIEADPGALGWKGMQTLTSSSVWAVGAQADRVEYDGALLEVHPAGSKKGDPFWWVAFDTSNIKAAIETGVIYKNAYTPGVGSPLGVPGLTLGYTQTCGPGIGTFLLEAFSAEGDMSEDTLLTITAAFTERCKGWPGVVRGCVHYER